MPKKAAASAESVIDWLLEEENPSVRPLTLTKLLGRKEGGAEAARARAGIMEQGAVPRILKARNAEGSWGEPGAFYTDKYRGTAWQLLVLAELGADGKDPSVRKACECLLGASQNPETGGFSVQESVKKGGGLPSYVIPCLTGNVVYSLLKLGYLGDARVDAAVQWLCGRLRFDDGDGKPPADDYYRRFESCYGRHSCHMGVVKALKGLAEIPAAHRSAAVKSTIDKGVEYILIHHVHKKSHELSAVSKPGWLKFGFPLMYQTDSLEILLILRSLGIDDPRMEEALEAVRKARGPDGRWSMMNSYNDRMIVNIEKKGAPSKWITLRALLALGEKP
jgi:hypothetical protein